MPDAAKPLESVPPEADISPPEMDFKSENEICDVCFLSLSNQQNHFRSVKFNLVAIKGSVGVISIDPLFKKRVMSDSQRYQ